MAIEGSGSTRAGGDAIHNEDVFLVEEGLGLYVVCDGDGARPAGEVAARLAARAIEDFLERVDEEIGPVPASRAAVHGAMREAIGAVADAGRLDPEVRGSATTITMLLAQGRRGVIGHRGDSRAYLIRRDRSQQLTVDHELSDGAEPSGELAEDFDVFEVSLEEGDTLVLCSDGAEGAVQQMARVAGEVPPHVLASRIVSAANREDPSRDATAVVVRLRGVHEPGWLELSMPPSRTAFGHTLAPASA